MRHDAQFNLAVVSAGDHETRRRDKSLAHFASLGRADRNVLQIRIVARQPAGDRHGLRVMRMNSASQRLRELSKFVGVGAFEFGQRTVLQNLLGQRIVVRQFLQHFFIGAAGTGGGFFHHRQTELVKKYFPQLLGRSHVERPPRQRVNLILKPGHLLGKGVRHARQRIAVNLNARHLHLGQHGHQRAFQRFVNRGHPFLVQHRLELLPQPQGDIGILSRIAHSLNQWHAVKGYGRFPRPQQRLDRDWHMAQMGV